MSCDNLGQVPHNDLGNDAGILEKCPAKDTANLVGIPVLFIHESVIDTIGITYKWQIGPFWQDTLDISSRLPYGIWNQYLTCLTGSGWPQQYITLNVRNYVKPLGFMIDHYRNNHLHAEIFWGNIQRYKMAFTINSVFYLNFSWYPSEHPF